MEKSITQVVDENFWELLSERSKMKKKVLVNGTVFSILIALVLGTLWLWNWLLVKGIIWTVYELFNLNWYNKFWVVFVFTLLVQLFLGKIKFTKGG